MKLLLLKITLLLAAMLCAPSVAAGTATNLVKAKHQRLLRLARMPHTPARQAALRAQLDTMFDSNTIAQAIIGKHGSGLTQAQRKQSTELLSRLWGRTYAQLVEHAAKHNFKIRYLGERTSSHGVWVLTEARASPAERWSVDYLVKNGKVSDLRIESMSLVHAYRAQVRRVLRKDGYRGLLGKLEAQLAKPPVALPAPKPLLPGAKQPTRSSTGALVVGAVALVALVAVLAWYDR